MDLDLRDRRTAGLPLVAGAVTGVLAYVAGFVGAFAAYLVVGLRPLDALAIGPTSDPGFAGAWFAFYGGHLVPVSVDGEWVNFALEYASHGVLYVLLVAAVLGSTGYYLGSADGLSGARHRALAGVTATVGYFPLATAGATAVSYEWPTSTGSGAREVVVVTIPLPIAGLLAGLLVPGVAGAAGGLLAERLAGSEPAADEEAAAGEARGSR